MTNHINFKRKNMFIKESLKMYRDFLRSETCQETKTKPKKIVQKIGTFNEKTFLQQQITDEDFTLLKPTKLYIDIEKRICNYTNNYTAMTVKMSCYYYNNYISISKCRN